MCFFQLISKAKYLLSREMIILNDLKKHTFLDFNPQHNKRYDGFWLFTDINSNKCPFLLRYQKFDNFQNLIPEAVFYNIKICGWYYFGVLVINSKWYFTFLLPICSAFFQLFVTFMFIFPTYWIATILSYLSYLIRSFLWNQLNLLTYLLDHEIRSWDRLMINLNLVTSLTYLPKVKSYLHIHMAQG